MKRFEHFTIGEVLAVQARERPAQRALAFPYSGGELTYAEWWQQSRALARSLLELGVAPGEHVALLAENRIEWPVVQLAVAIAGAVLVPLNTHYAREELGFALSKSRSRVIFLSAQFRSHAYLEMVSALRPELPDLREIVVLDVGHAGCLLYHDLVAGGGGVQTAIPESSSRDVASLQYTSGTTGFPKGALLAHEGMLLDARVTAERLGITPDDRWTSIIPLFHCAGCIMNVLGCLQAGACYVGVPFFDPERMFEVIARERCTALSGVPTSFLAMLEHPRRSFYDLGSLRTGTCGGADVDGALLRRCAQSFPIPWVTQVYGQTEASTLIACPSFDDPARFDTAGPPIDGCEVRVTDPRTAQALPADTIGQIEVRGPIVMLGYYGCEDETVETLDAEGWLKTGDLGRLTQQGHVAIEGGRLRDMIIRGGENIYPVEVENVIARHPAVAQAAVFGIRDRHYGETVAAAVALRNKVGAGELARFCTGRIAKFKIPVRWFRTETFPMTSSGKIRKGELREMADADRLEVLE
ncbi:MAG: AMP-binding protein [Gammaproteobacteria bacterium]|nr:AMP-binding protein [Gammaproteobacteria bacterium]NIN37887.1 AMP-binding protein [Gammaproteobacteria bacterium]NIO25624.1 AMP-binding protein [Gammaproteobacteria bacterium]NIO66260.1 AMP-binding protein [Gammaproteobacteria bacterium]NIP65234.1 AMP-binding protein [Gammaproteobacteria bacterium]